MPELEIDKLYLGDGLELMEYIPDKSIHLIKADLPFGTTNCRWDSPIDLTRLWACYERIIKDNGAILLNAQTPFDKVLGASNLKMLRYEWIWEKTQATGHYNAKKMPMKAHENILVFYKNLPTYNPHKTTGHKPINSYTKYLKTQNHTEVYGKATREVSGGGNTDRYPRSILVFPNDKQRTCLHSTQKPVALEEYFIRTYTNEGDLVLDNVAGSGTTAIAAINTNRRWIAIEKDKREFDKAKKRIDEHLSKKQKD